MKTELFKRDKTFLKILKKNYNFKIKVRKVFLKPNPFSRPKTKLAKVSGICIHWIGNTGTSADANRGYFDRLANQNPKDMKADRYASAHAIVGLLGEIIQCIPWLERAYHVGAKTYKPEALKRLDTTYPNARMIGLEACHEDESGRPNDTTLYSLVCITAFLCYKFNLDPKKDIYRHYDITGKKCHKFYVDNPNEWKSFLVMVESALVSKLWRH